MGSTREGSPGSDDGPGVLLTNRDKVLYPATGTTKADVFAYYTAIAEVMLPHIAARPATRKRWPDGVGAQSFFEKRLAPSAPAWLSRGTVVHKSGATVYPVIDSAAGLAWIAQQAALELHVPQWRFVDGQPGPATRLVFDLDPGDGVDLPRLTRVARAIGDLIAGIGLTALPLTSGSKGLHLYVPLAEPVSSTGAVVLAKRVAHQLERDMPDLVTSTMARGARAGKVLVDWSQNNATKTTVAPYSLRGRTQPTVAAPRSWAELDDPDLRQLRYDEVLTRVARDGDLLAALDPGRRRTGADGHPRQKEFGFDQLEPMLARAGSVAALTAGQWAFEGKWDGYRLLADADHGSLRLRSRGGRDVTGEFAQLASLGAALADHRAVLDGEVVGLDEAGVPSFAALQHRRRGTRVEFWAFDLLYLDGRSLLRAGYRDRRKLLETLGAGVGLVVPALIDGDGADALSYAGRQGWEGVVAKRWNSMYSPGQRSAGWVKDKHWHTQDVVIAGWSAGGGARSGGIGGLLMAVPGPDGWSFAGRVGTGFTGDQLGQLKALLEPLRTDESPFRAPLLDRDIRDVTFVEPTLVGEVRYREWTPDGRLRHPSWRGLRPDTAPAQVVREQPR